MCKVCDQMRRDRRKLPVMKYSNRTQQKRIEARLKRKKPFYIEAEGLTLYVGSNAHVWAKVGRYYQESKGHIVNFMKGHVRDWQLEKVWSKDKSKT